MISKDDFKAKMRDVCLLAGIRDTQETRDQLAIFYRKIQVGKYELRDFVKACEDEGLLAEYSRRRCIDWPTLKQTIEKYAMERFEKEEEINKRKRERMEREFFNNEDIPKEFRDFIKKFRGTK